MSQGCIDIDLPEAKLEVQLDQLDAAAPRITCTKLSQVRQGAVVCSVTLTRSFTQARGNSPSAKATRMLCPIPQLCTALAQAAVHHVIPSTSV